MTFMLAPEEQPIWVYAMHLGDEAILATLLRAVGAELLNAPDDDVETPLLLALSNRRLVPLVPLLLAAGADPNLEGLNGMLPLALAARMPRDSPERALVGALLDAGAEVGLCEDSPQSQSHGWSALSIAAGNNDVELVQRLLQHSSATLDACLSRDSDGVALCAPETASAQLLRQRAEELARKALVELCVGLEPLDLPVLCALAIFECTIADVETLAAVFNSKRQWDVAAAVKKVKPAQ